MTRARQVLLDHLSPAQRAEFERTGTFTVRGKWGRRYKVRHNGCVDGPFLLRGFGTTFGIWPDCEANLPLENIMLAMKLLLETDERRFRRIACWMRNYG